MEMEVSKQEKENQKKGAITSVFAHVAILLIALLPLMTFPDPPPGPAGVLVSFGEPEQGMNDDKAGGIPEEVVEEVEETVEETPQEPEPPKPEPPKPDPKPEPPKPKESTKVNTDDNSRELAIKRKKEKEAREKREAEAEKKRIADAAARKKREAEAKKKAEADAKRAAEEAARQKKEAEAQALKDAIGGAFGSGSGNGGNPGDQGQPDGDPDGSALDGVSTGSGDIGGGLAGRKVLSRPRITDNSQKTGDVMVKVCVDNNGKVISAKFTQAGSTTNNQTLINKAIAGAKKFKFEKGSVEKQCGTIKIKFRF